MLASATQQRLTESTPHPRRVPPRLSVSLRHENGPMSSTPIELGHAVANVSRASPCRHDSLESGNSGQLNMQKWFAHSNTRPETGYTHAFEDNEPPYFLPHHSSSTSNNDGPFSRREGLYLAPGTRPSVSHSSSADDFRSVIDDLTIENKKLKERLRKYERLQPAQLEKDKLFELKIHGLSRQKRRELEDVLSKFASSVEAESVNEDAKESRSNQSRHYSALHPQLSSSTVNTKHTPSSSTSNSRPNDSAYASMSTPGPNSTPFKNLVFPERTSGSQFQLGREQNIQSFLHNIPEGLLPKHPPLMTERQKKKLVVQRLEQLFTGKKGAQAGENSQPIQQQEVSNSAARADQARRHRPSEEEGAREAHILPMELDAACIRPSKLFGGASDGASGARVTSDSSDEQSPERSSPKQRPTRPLDLDPDRAQIPSENVEYIRHLGLSTPKLISEDSADVAADAEGWIYLNLLINMAQLHIINVTPEFVRSAVSDVSEKFQLSLDGKKVRWRGGSDGTLLSSDSGESSVRNRSPQDSGNEPGSRKRRKVEVGRFASAHVDNAHIPGEIPGPLNKFHYKPLFRHQSSSSGSMLSADGDFPLEAGLEMDSDPRRSSRGAQAWRSVSHLSGTKRRREDGPIVFYSGAKFCTDLSGDGENIVKPQDVPAIDQYEYSDKAHVALGFATQTSTLQCTRTASGSLLPYRPFKDYPKDHGLFQDDTDRQKTPELFIDETDDEQFSSNVPLGSPPCVRLQDFEASGLGGVQPADHFAVEVQTRWERSNRPKRTKLSRFSKPSCPGKHPKKFLHGISKESINSFHETTVEEAIANRLAAWPGFSSPPRSTDITANETHVKTQVLSSRYVHLEPSELPPPVSWVTAMSSSDDASDSSTSSVGSTHRRDDTKFEHPYRGSFEHRQDSSSFNDAAFADDSNDLGEASDSDSERAMDTSGSSIATFNDGGRSSHAASEG